MTFSLTSPGHSECIQSWPGHFAFRGTVANADTPPNAGGNFGVKLTMFPHMVVMCIASRLAGRPVKWVEDRLEHLAAANAAPNRVTHIHAAYTTQGEVTAIRFEHWDDHGAYLRAPKLPGPIFRMHGTTSNGYKVRHLDVKMNIVATNKCPSGAVRGFGGPQLYFGLERLMHRIAVELDVDPLEVIRRNLLPPNSFPYRAPASTVCDYSGNYQRCVEEAISQGRLADLKRKRTVRGRGGRFLRNWLRNRHRTQPVQHGLHLNSQNARGTGQGWPKGWSRQPRHSDRSIHLDRSRSLRNPAPQGQGHATVLAQIVADQLGLSIDDVAVNLEFDTKRPPGRLHPAIIRAGLPRQLEAPPYSTKRVREKLALIASSTLNVSAERLEFAISKS